jgi:hypothetical protein
LIDTNVLLDLATDDPAWADWSVRHLDAAQWQARPVTTARNGRRAANADKALAALHLLAG